MLDCLPMNKGEQHPLDFYRARAGMLCGVLLSAERRGAWLSNIRLLTFLGALGLSALTFAGKLPGAGYVCAALSFAFFVAAAVLHDRTIERERRTRLGLALALRGAVRTTRDERSALALLMELPSFAEASPSSASAGARRKELLDLVWALRGGGESHVDGKHLYASDLELFGPHSLFSLLDSTSTRAGEERLAAWLLSPTEPEALARRQRAVAELSTPRASLALERLEVEGHLLGIARALPTWRGRAEAKRDLSKHFAYCDWPPTGANHPALTLARRLLPPLLLASLAAALAGISALPLVALLALQGALALARLKPNARLIERASLSGERLSSFERLFGAAEALYGELEPQSEVLRALRERLLSSGALPSREFARLSRALAMLKLREQPLLHLPLALFTLWDLHWCAALERWRERCGAAAATWVEVLAELEALASLAHFSRDNPSYVFPAVEGTRATFDAEALGHPLLAPQSIVANDVALSAPVRAYLVSGSNMAGKSTLLRAMGLNAVLAQAGAPVCAARLRMGPMAICTSMSIHDSLSEGISLFMAELHRIKRVVDCCRERPSLFLLDEVLHGTNTAERHAASRAIIARLIACGAVGAIATHDLALATLEEESGGAIANVHFTDHLAHGAIAFDYRLRRGVVTTTNALALLRQVGVDVALPREGQGISPAGPG